MTPFEKLEHKNKTLWKKNEKLTRRIEEMGQEREAQAGLISDLNTELSVLKGKEYHYGR